MNDITVVLFDLGRVLMHIDFEAFPNGLGLAAAEERLPYDHRIKPFVRLYEEGKITTEEFLDSLYAIFDCRFSRERILEAFNDIIVEDNHEIIPFVDSVKKNYRLAVLSNTCECHWRKVENISSIIGMIPDRYTSFRIGSMKPDPAAYRAVSDSLGTSAEQILFIDDLKENVEGARAVGMKGIIYRNTRQLQSDFDRQNW